MGQNTSISNQSDPKLIQLFPNTLMEIKNTKKTTYEIISDDITFDYEKFQLLVKSIGIDLKIKKNQGSNYDFSISNQKSFKNFFLFKNTNGHQAILKVVASLIYIKQEKLAFEFLVFLDNNLRHLEVWSEFYFTNKKKQSDRSDFNYDNQYQEKGAPYLHIENMNHYSKEELLNILNEKILNVEFHRRMIGFIKEKSQQHIKNWEKYEEGSDGIKNLYRDLEYDHAFIQWIFPNFFISRFNPNSRRLTLEERNEIIKNQEYTEFYLKNFRMFMRFLGIKVNDQFKLEMVFKDQFEKCVLYNTHNLMRLQRVFASLSVLGQRELALGFLKFLKNTLNNLNQNHIYERDFKYFEILKEEDNQSNIYFKDMKNFYFQLDILDQWYVTPLILTKQLINEEDYIKKNKTNENNQFSTNQNNYQKDLNNQFGQDNSSNNNQIQQGLSSIQNNIQSDKQKSQNSDDTNEYSNVKKQK